MVVHEAHTPRIRSTGDLTVESGGILAMSMPGSSRALEVSTDADSTITTLDSKAKKLKIKTPDLTLTGNSGGFKAAATFGVEAGAPEKSTLAATEANLTMGTQVNANGGKVDFSVASTCLSNEDSAICQTEDTITYRSPWHDFITNDTEVVTMRDDKVTFHVPVEIQGTLNSIDGDQTILNVRDPVIELATKKDTEADIAGGPAGIQIETVPADSSSVPYVARFKAADGSSLFIDGEGNVDVPKAASAGIFDKRIALETNGGAADAGKRTTASRLGEPAWDMAGGQMRLVRFVPDADVHGRVNVYAMVLRVTDEGYFEVGRLKQVLNYDSATCTYTGSAPSFSLMHECL